MNKGPSRREQAPEMDAALLASYSRSAQDALAEENGKLRTALSDLLRLHELKLCFMTDEGVSVCEEARALLGGQLPSGS